MRPIYKKVKVAMPHCPECGEQLQGNNSLAMPWTCKCGEWEAEFTTEGEWTFEYKIKNAGKNT